MPRDIVQNVLPAPLRRALVNASTASAYPTVNNEAALSDYGVDADGDPSGNYAVLRPGGGQVVSVHGIGTGSDGDTFDVLLIAAQKAALPEGDEIHLSKLVEVRFTLGGKTARAGGPMDGFNLADTVALQSGLGAAKVDLIGDGDGYAATLRVHHQGHDALLALLKVNTATNANLLWKAH